MQFAKLRIAECSSHVLSQTRPLVGSCMRVFAFCAMAAGLTCEPTPAQTEELAQTVRLATFNCSLNRARPGQLLQDLQDDGNAQMRNIARIVRETRPQVLLLNEFDYEPNLRATQLFRQHYLESNADWCESPPLEFPFCCCLPVNTGVDSGCDLDHNGKTGDAADAFGFGRFPGQYGMVLLSQFPIQHDDIRTFRRLLWRQMPQAALPRHPTTDTPWYTDQELQVFRLSSKSHWDVPITVGDHTLHILASHPTPPAFDGPEDRNGRRNHDEIRLWADYVSPDRSHWITDDEGQAGGLTSTAHFAILGDLNADPEDGGSYRSAITQLLDHPRVNSEFPPRSMGAAMAAATQGKVNAGQAGPPELDTADFNDSSVGNLRVDYVLPSRSLQVRGSGVFWPAPEDAAAAWVRCSDHRLVWVDVSLPDARHPAPQ